MREDDAVEQVLGESAGPVAWVCCSPARAARRVLPRIVSAIAAAVPGSADALAEPCPPRPSASTGWRSRVSWSADLSRLLVEPLVLVIDDAEQLDGADDSLGILDELLRAELPLLHVAVASRRPLALQVAKSRAAGRLTELTAADLAFDAEECAELLRRRTGAEPSTERVEVMMELTEGWPLGLALAAGLVERAAEAGDVAAALGDLRSAPTCAHTCPRSCSIRSGRSCAARHKSSVVPVVTPAVERVLGLPEEFRARVERAGLLVRPYRRAGVRLPPAAREFLLDGLRAEPGEAE